MKKLQITSNIVFLYFKDMHKAKSFFIDTLGLEIAYDPGWACVFKLGGKSFIGAVDQSQGSIEVKAKGGTLISITVNNIEEAYEKIKNANAEGLSEIKQVKALSLKSFFFKGPEGYEFEIQHFGSPELKEIFG